MPIKQLFPLWIFTNVIDRSIKEIHKKQYLSNKKTKQQKEEMNVYWPAHISPGFLYPRWNPKYWIKRN